MKNKKSAKRIYPSTIKILLIAILAGIVTLDFSFTTAWGEKMKTVENTAESNVFADYETETLFGDPFTNEDTAKAKLTAYNVWETTCPACLGEMDELEEVSQHYAPEDFQLVGLCFDLFNKDGELKPDQLEKAKSLMTDAGTTFPHIIPTEGMSMLIESTAPGFPTTYFVDQNGTIIDTVCGANDTDGWIKKIDSLLEKTGS